MLCRTRCKAKEVNAEEGCVCSTHCNINTVCVDNTQRDEEDTLAFIRFLILILAHVGQEIEEKWGYHYYRFDSTT